MWEDYTWIVVLGCLAAFFTAYGIGANDVANAFGSSVAARTLTMRQALLIAAVCEFGGSVLLGGQVTRTVASGIARLESFEQVPEIYMYGMLCALVSSGTWLLLATYLGLPVSTTHSIAGAVLGFAFVYGGPRAVVWLEPQDDFPYMKGMVPIVVSWFISPLSSSLASALLFFIVRSAILRRESSLELAFWTLPLLVLFTVFINMYFVLDKGADNRITWPSSKCAWVSACIAAGCTLLTILVGMPIVRQYVYTDLDQRRRQQLSELESQMKADGGSAMQQSSRVSGRRSPGASAAAVAAAGGSMQALSPSARSLGNPGGGSSGGGGGSDPGWPRRGGRGRLAAAAAASGPPPPGFASPFVEYKSHILNKQASRPLVAPAPVRRSPYGSFSRTVQPNDDAAAASTGGTKQQMVQRLSAADPPCGGSPVTAPSAEMGSTKAAQVASSVQAEESHESEGAAAPRPAQQQQQQGQQASTGDGGLEATATAAVGPAPLSAALDATQVGGESYREPPLHRDGGSSVQGAAQQEQGDTEAQPPYQPQHARRRIATPQGPQLQQQHHQQQLQQQRYHQHLQFKRQQSWGAYNQEQQQQLWQQQLQQQWQQGQGYGTATGFASHYPDQLPQQWYQADQQQQQQQEWMAMQQQRQMQLQQKHMNWQGQGCQQQPQLAYHTSYNSPWQQHPDMTSQSQRCLNSRPGQSYGNSYSYGNGLGRLVPPGPIAESLEWGRKSAAPVEGDMYDKDADTNDTAGAVPEPGNVHWQNTFDQLKAIVLQGTNVNVHDAIAADITAQRIHSQAEVFDPATEDAFKYLQVVTAICDSLSHGANDVANSVGPLAAIWYIYRYQRVDYMAKLPIWILVLGGAGIVVGLATYGYNIIRAIGVRLSVITPSRGFCIELSTALVVALASKYGLPVSTTHCQVGATAGMGLMEGSSGLHWRLALQFFLGWVVTLLLTGLLAAGLFAAGAFAPCIQQGREITKYEQALLNVTTKLDSLLNRTNYAARVDPVTWGNFSAALNQSLAASLQRAQLARALGTSSATRPVQQIEASDLLAFAGDALQTYLNNSLPYIGGMNAKGQVLPRRP